MLSPSLAYAQDAGPREAGVADAGRDVDADAGPGVDAGVADADAGTAVAPDDEAEDDEEESELPADRRPDVALRLEPETGTMTGDVVTAVITVTLTDGDDVAVPRQDFGDLELHDQRHSDRLVDGRREFTFELDFLMLEPGEAELLPIRLRVVTADGVVGIVRTEARTITVGSLTANEPNALPRPPTPADIVVMQDDYTLAWVLGIAAAMLLSALLGWLVARWWRARPREIPPPPPPRPPWEVALEKLAALRKELKTTTRDADAVVLVDRASDALRDYLGGRYDFNGLESTTDEVVTRVRNARLGSISLNEIIALLGDADLVKFAKAVPDQAQCERVIDGAERIVKGTIPMSTAVSRPAPSAALPGSKGASKGSSRRSGAPADWNAEIDVNRGRPEPVPEATRPGKSARRVDEDGNAIPDTIPPAAPGASGARAPAREPSTQPERAGETADGSPTPAATGVPHDTLRDGTIEGVHDPAARVPEPATPSPARVEADRSPDPSEPSRPTPVGFSDPIDRGPKP